ncbi:MAG: hypothetical protein ACFBWO_18175 [Paracoccaceae bacterium]
MANFEIGDLVVLKSGSMRMTVEESGEGDVGVVWCHEGTIGRDRFDVKLLNKWETREDGGGFKGKRDDRGGDRGGDRPRSFRDRDDRGGDRGGDRPRWQDRDDRGGDRDDRPRGGRWEGRDDRRGPPRDRDDRGGPPRKPGWDGKPRARKSFRKDD